MRKEDASILVVDDEEIMRSLFLDILHDEGYKVTIASNGKEAVDKARDAFFNIAFIDVHMPQMNGIQTFHELKKLNPNIAIVMTDSFPVQVLEELKKEGAVNCINKPFDIREVKAVINKIFSEGKDV